MRILRVLSQRKKKMTWYPNAVEYLDHRVAEFVLRFFPELRPHPRVKIRWSRIPNHKLEYMEHTLLANQKLEVEFKGRHHNSSQDWDTMTDEAGRHLSFWEIYREIMRCEIKIAQSSHYISYIEYGAYREEIRHEYTSYWSGNFNVKKESNHEVVLGP